MTNTLDFLNGRIHYALIDGQWWFHIKSICEALGVDYRRQTRTVSSHPILGPGVSIQTLQLDGKQARKHTMISEQRVAAWLFNIRSESEELLAFQVELADKIHEITRGQLAPISAAALVKREAQANVTRLEAALQRIPEFREWQAEKARATAAAKRIGQAASRQADMFAPSAS